LQPAIASVCTGDDAPASDRIEKGAMGHSKYYIIEAAGMVEKAKAFRRAYIEQSGKYLDFLESICATAYQVGFNDQLIGIQFPHDKRPAGWCKPKEYRGVSYPMKKSDWKEKMRALGQLPQIIDFFPELANTPCWIGYKGPTSEGGRQIGDIIQPIQLCWYSADSPFMLMLPDVERAIQVVKIEHPDATLRDGIESWRPLAGLREILIEEWDFMVAKHK
jgi:hypothetical protein